MGGSVLFCNVSTIRSLRPDFALLAFIFCLPVPLCSAFTVQLSFSFVPFNDISNDAANPPQYRLSRSERQLHISGFGLWGALQASGKIAAHPDILSIKVLALLDLVYGCALRTSHTLNWKVTIREPSSQNF